MELVELPPASLRLLRAAAHLDKGEGMRVTGRAHLAEIDARKAERRPKKRRRPTDTGK